MNNTIKERIELLRKEMIRASIDVYIIPSSDPHKSEYVTDTYKSRAFITGFTGSAGLAVVTKESCHLWTDGRYFIQAEREISGTDIVLEKMNEPGVKTYQEWIDGYVIEDMTIGYDQRLFSIAEINKLKQSIHKKVHYDGSKDLIDLIWINRPSMPKSKAFVHDIVYAGTSVIDKCKLVRNQMAQIHADDYIISSLNDIAWLLNIRGNDVAYTPVIYGFVLITKSSVYFYVDASQLTKEVTKHLEASKVSIKPYLQIYEDITSIEKDHQIVYDPNFTNGKLVNAISSGCKSIEEDELCKGLKAVLTDSEINNLRNCQVRDGVAMVQFLHWLDQNIGHTSITEKNAADQLEAFRKQQAYFIEPSFHTIPAYEDNAAMMHYSTDPSNSPVLKPKGFFLIDSGGQYLDGTTDITRTVVLGPVSDIAKKDFTLVLKAHIQLSRFIFLQGTTGNEMDAIARQPIWQERKDYKSGTGHGIGYLLGVHEGFQRIGRGVKPVVLKPGMIITNEPGIYIEGKYGIRTENTLLVIKDISNDFGDFLKFETISYCPIDRRAIVKELLTTDEINWLNNYHEAVYQHLSNQLDTDTQSWLKEMTAPL